MTHSIDLYKQENERLRLELAELEKQYANLEYRAEALVRMNHSQSLLIKKLTLNQIKKL